eukprot:6193320-Pleurochrysis_carterae.AAC.2
MPARTHACMHARSHARSHTVTHVHNHARVFVCSYASARARASEHALMDDLKCAGKKERMRTRANACTTRCFHT